MEYTNRQWPDHIKKKNKQNSNPQPAATYPGNQPLFYNSSAGSQAAVKSDLQAVRLLSRVIVRKLNNNFSNS